MSLASCISKSGISDDLKSEIEDAVAANIGKGMPQSQAEREAVRQKQNEVLGMIEQVRNQLARKGYDVAKIDIDTPKVPKKESVENLSEGTLPEKTETPAIDKTPEGEQTVIKGAEKINDKQLAEKKMGEKKYATIQQKPMDDGLFDIGARNQQTIKFATQPLNQTLPYSSVKPKPSARAKASQADQAAAIRNAAERILGKGASKRVVLADRITKDGNTKEIAGANLAESKIIAIAMNAPRPDGVLRHEAIHYLRDAGLINAAGWDVLSQQAKRWRKMFDIDARYKDLGLSEAELNEEAIADGYQAWYNGDLDLSSGTLNSIMQKLADFYAAVRDYLFNQHGVQSWGDIFDAIESGAVGGEVQSAPGYSIEVGKNSVKLVAPDGEVTEHSSLRDAEYAATDAAVFNELRLGADQVADFSLSEEEAAQARAFREKYTHTYNGSLTKAAVDMVKAVAGMSRDGTLKDAMRNFGTRFRQETVDTFSPVLANERQFNPDRLDRQQPAYVRANLAAKSSAIFDVFINERKLKWSKEERRFLQEKGTDGWLKMLAPVLTKEHRDLFQSYWLAKSAVEPRTRMLDMKKAKELYGDAQAKKLFLENKIYGGTITVGGKEMTMAQATKKHGAEKAEKMFANSRITDGKIKIKISDIDYGTEKNITEAEAKEIISMVNSKTDKDGKNLYKDTLDNMQEYHRRIIDGLIGSGEIAEENREFWDHEFYAPAKKMMEDAYDYGRGRRGKIVKTKTGGPDIFNVLDKDGQPFKEQGKVVQYGIEQAQAVAKSIGGTVQREIQKRQDLFLSMAELHAAMLQKTYQTVASQNVIQVLEAANLAHVVNDETDFKSEFLANNGLSQEENELFAPLINKGNNTIGIKFNGKVTTYRINDPSLMKMMEHLAGYASYSPNAATRTLMGAKGFFTDMVTITPAFQMRNPVRDVGVRTFLSTDQARIIEDTLNGFQSAMKMDDVAIDLMLAGGDIGYFTRTAEDVMNKMNKKASPAERGAMYWASPMRAIDGMHKMGRVSELAGRIAMFEAARRKGATDLEAGFEAADVGDYSRKGAHDAVRFLTGITPFLNPMLQGIDKVARSLNRAQVRKNIWMKSLVLMGISTLMTAHNTDDEEKRRDLAEAPDYVKDTNFLINVREIKEYVLGRKLQPGESPFIAIPKPFEFGLPATIVERTYVAAQNDMLDGRGAGNWSDAADAGTGFIIGMLAFNPLSNPLINVPLEQVTNYKFFSRQPIEPKSSQNLRPKDRYSDSTSGTSIAISEMIDDAVGSTISPARIEHLINGTTAGLGEIVLTAMDAATGTRPTPRASSIPVVGTFTASTMSKGNQVRNDFYKLDKQITETQGSLNRYKKDRMFDAMRELQSRPKTKALLAIKPQMEALKKRMDARQSQINALQRGGNGLTPDQRRDQIDALTQKLNDDVYIFRDINLRYEELREKE